jgi:hypothetical protein
MKHSLSVFAIAVIVGASVVAAQTQQAPPTPPAADAKAPAKAAGPAGKWTLNLEGPQGAMSIALDVKVDPSSKVTGTLTGPNGALAIAGEVKDGVLGFSFNFDAGGTPMEIYCEAKIDKDDKMAGTMAIGDMGKFPFTGTREKG